MENKADYHNKSMDEIVFDKRNKNYGAFLLRQIYTKHLLKALGISVCAFIFSMYTPAIAKSLGLFEEKPPEMLDTTSHVLEAPPALKPDEPPPPPPPPVEEVQRPTVRFLEIEAAKKEDVVEPPPPTIEEVADKDIGKENIEGTKTDEPEPIIEKVTGNEGIDTKKIYEKVEQMPEFVGGRAKLDEFIEDNLVYPPEASADEIEGTAQVYFVVNDDGGISEVQLAKTSGNAKLDAEAIRMVKKMPRWKPGKQNGVAVRVRCLIPIEFVISD
jgi:protein TonB